MKIKSFKDYLPQLSLLIVTILTYGLLIPKLGFYGDDWSYIYYHQLMGFKGPGLFASYDRPFSAPFYNVVISVLGTNPLPYHILLIILRFVSAILLWEILRKLWPQKERSVFWISLIFLVYPGFSQQPIAVEYILHFTGLDLYLLSVLLMLISLRVSKFRWIAAIAGVFFSLNLFAIEYFAGLELIRPIILWIAIGKQGSKRNRLTNTIIQWMPYLIVLFAFFVWRVFLFQFPTYTPNLLSAIEQSPIAAIIDLGKQILLDIKTVIYNAWKQTISFPTMGINRLFFIGSLLLNLTILLFIQRSLWGKVSNKEESHFVRQEWALQPISLGAAALIFAGIPFWVTGIPIEMGFPWDRPTLPFMIGISLVIVGFIDLIIRENFRHWFIIILTCLAIGFHIDNAEAYQFEWENTKDFYWQLIWRAPGLENGSVLVSDEIPLYRVADSAMTAPLNWIYAPDLFGPNLSFKLFDLNVRLGTEYTGIPAIEESLPISHDYRSTEFSSTTSSIVVFFIEENGCLRILSPLDADLPFLPEKVKTVLPLSNPELIKTGSEAGVQPPAFLFPEKRHEWCFYFQKAELAKQQGDWESVAAIGNEAFQNDLKPKNRAELLTFIEGYAHIEDFEKTEQWTVEVQKEKSLKPALCRTWQKLYEEIGDHHANRIDQIYNQIGCE